MPANPGRLTAKQQAAIEAMLLHPTVEAAAKAAGTSSRSVRRWFDEDPDFRREFRRARARATEAAVTRLQGLSAAAAETLGACLGDDNPTVRLRAAGMIVDFAVRGVELADFAERLEALEALAAQGGKS